MAEREGNRRRMAAAQYAKGRAGGANSTNGWRNIGDGRAANGRTKIIGKGRAANGRSANTRNGREARWHKWLLQYELFRRWPGGGANSTNGWRSIKYFGNGRGVAQVARMAGAVFNILAMAGGGRAGLGAMAAQESNEKTSLPRRYGGARIQQ